ncbi:MAG: hypothetical protein ACKVPX_11565 [Myxococcaceae bacterium]
MSTDGKSTKILARTFFSQLRSNGYTPSQVIAVATELIDLVTSDLREGDKVIAQTPPAQTAETAPRA